ncbi:MAG: hypothetical protein ACFB0B_02665 [Thermonemataceae bacterium]
MANDFFNKLFKKLFLAESNERQKVITHKKLLVRGDDFKKSYFKWLNGHEYQNALNAIEKAYWKKREKEEATWAVHLLQMPYANGFAISYPSEFSSQEFQFIFELLKDRSIHLGYTLVDATTKLTDKLVFVETVDKYYLKPPLKSEQLTPPIDQLYGNISIEHTWVDNQPSYIKYVATLYTDRLYKKALPFDQLIHQLFH